MLIDCILIIFISYPMITDYFNNTLNTTEVGTKKGLHNEI